MLKSILPVGFMKGVSGVCCSTLSRWCGVFALAAVVGFWGLPAKAAELSFAEAEAVLMDTHLVSLCLQPVEALEARNLNDGKALMAVALCGVDCMDDLPQGQVRRRFMPEDAAFFKEYPGDFNMAVTREAMEKSALRFAGRSLAGHRSYGDVGLFVNVEYKDGLYWYMADGLGGVFAFPKLVRVEAVQQGHVLYADLFYEEVGERVGTLTVTIVPGEAPGSWKRLSIVKDAKEEYK